MAERDKGGWIELSESPHLDGDPRWVPGLDGCVTTDEILLGLALTVALAVGSQILASRLRIPALIVLLPAGFLAGALTDDVHPTNSSATRSNRWSGWLSR